MSSSYLFAKNIISASQVFLVSKFCFAFVNISPLVPGHVLVSPKRVVPRFYNLTDDEVSDMSILVKKIAPKLENHFNCSALTISMQDGKDAGQSVEHVHVHILPRKPGDFENNDNIYQKLQNHDKVPRKIRSASEMENEANELRKLFEES